MISLEGLFEEPGTKNMVLMLKGMRNTPFLFLIPPKVGFSFGYPFSLYLPIVFFNSSLDLSMGLFSDYSMNWN